MKAIKQLNYLIFASALFISCKKNSEDITVTPPPPPVVAKTEWVKLAPHSSSTHLGKLFTLNGDIYVLIFDDGSLFQYLSSKDEWVKKTNFPGPTTIRYGYFTTAINGKVIVGGGSELSWGMPFNDMWEYDPLVNKWTSKKNLPNYIGDAVTTVFDNKVYYFNTRDNAVTIYDPASDQYTRIKDRTIPSPFEIKSAFVINGKQYFTNKAFVLSRLIEYDPISDTWKEYNTIPTKVTSHNGFALNNIGYIMGENQYLWKYDSVLDTWTKIDDRFWGYPNVQHQFVVLNNSAYLGLSGNSPTANIASFYATTDFWKYK